MTNNNSNYVLYFDTSQPEAVSAVYNDGALLSETRWEAGRELSATLMSRYEETLKKQKISQKEISGICVFVGPGSFTGLRIGISFANGLAYAMGVPIYETKKRGNIDLSNPKKIALPFYGSAPIITKPRQR
jgi:tRNA threonylcarbamoyladenosine biosynthesis protein TsaB